MTTDFRFLTDEEYKALTAPEKTDYDAAVKRQWVIMEAEDAAIRRTKGAPLGTGCAPSYFYGPDGEDEEYVGV